jgi:hypothetical protein
MENVEASTTCSDHRDFELTLRSIAKFYDLRVISTNGLLPALDLSRFRAAPCARLSHFPFECDGAFPA